MCFTCAAKASVPAAPDLMAPATEEILDGRGARALILEWSEPTCPAPIDMYQLQVPQKSPNQRKLALLMTATKSKRTL